MKKIYLFALYPLCISLLVGIFSKPQIPAFVDVSGLSCSWDSEISDPETCYATGAKIPFSKVALYDLQLIPTISDARSGLLLEYRENILQIAKSEQAEESHKAFTSVHGIGQKTAATLGEYLYVE